MAPDMQISECLALARRGLLSAFDVSSLFLKELFPWLHVSDATGISLRVPSVMVTRKFPICSVTALSAAARDRYAQ
jgi:hypothetical protein